MPYVKKSFIKLKIFSLKLESFLLDSKLKSFGKNSYVIDYVWNRVRGRKGFRCCKYDDLKKKIES